MARAQNPAPAAKENFAQPSVAIMAIGDSITAVPWFRRALKADFEKAGIPTDFVGTQHGANPEGGFTDGEHEGYPGYKIDGVEKLLRDPQKGAITRFRADVILVTLGTNDIGQGQLANAPARLDELVKLLLRAQPNARIVLATIPPILPFAFSGYGEHGADVSKFNASVVGLAAQYAETRRVFLADVYSALPPTKEYIGDGVHPSGYGVAATNDGYKRMGDAYFTAICAALKAAPLHFTNTPSRSRLSLDGTWLFTPAGPQQGPETSPAEIAKTAPGAVFVPGSWMEDRDWLARGSGSGIWGNFDARKTFSGWYDTTIAIPADWRGRRVCLEVGRVATDARVTVNGKDCGAVSWPEGTVDVTNAIQPGQEANLRVFVAAAADGAMVTRLMGAAPGQNVAEKVQVSAGGLIGHIALFSEPQGSHISDVWVKTSVRKKAVSIETELSGVPAGTPVRFVAHMLNEVGNEEETFTTTANAAPVVTLRFPWSNPRLWDVGQPNHYTLHLEMRTDLSTEGAAVTDVFAQEFGFREFRLQKRDFFLNEKPIRLRPALAGGPDHFADTLASGFNFVELWPEDFFERGRSDSTLDSLQTADEIGIPASGILPHMGWMGGNINTPERQAAYLTVMQAAWRKQRNHPSAVLWGTSGNMMGGPLDPALIGRRAASIAHESRMGSDSGAAYARTQTVLDRIKALDPTRPVFVHNGGPVGDIFTLNTYLNNIPLQEREEWLSTYLTKADMPLWYVEFGTPLYSDIMRGRNNYGNTTATEPLLTEYSAIYQGTDAYRRELPEYRKEIVAQFINDQTYRGWHANRIIAGAPAWQELQRLLISNVWRTWRIEGLTFGMIPWDNGYAVLDGKTTVAGAALRAVNGPTLACLAGHPNAVAEKSHHFRPDQKVIKSLALLNDDRQTLPAVAHWEVIVSRKRIAQGNVKRTLAPAETALIPILFTTPDVAVKTGGEIRLTATIGGVKSTDAFPFRIFPSAAPKAPKTRIFLFDPAGETRAMLKALGVAAAPLGKTMPPSGSLVVVGRKAMGTTGTLPDNMEAFVAAGGRVLVCPQNPWTLRDAFGLRVSYKASRYVFPVGGSAVTTGIDNSDLRDWSGKGTLINPYPDYSMGQLSKNRDTAFSPANFPYAGWRHGLQGTVSTAPIEKPHRAGWRPLMECEFDLAYSPLMELDYGKGRIILNQLDLEDQISADPAAEKTARQLIAYAAAAPLLARVPAVYLGGTAGADTLDALGLIYRRVTVVPGEARLLIAGPDIRFDDARVIAFAQTGGRVLFLAGEENGAVSQQADVIGSLDVPNWPETRGLSASDLRWRAPASGLVLTASSGEVAADGLLSRRVIGKGVILATTIAPDRVPADKRTYLRFTRWRQTRALTQILANLGGTFQEDSHIFRPQLAAKAAEIALDGPWQAKLLKPLPPAPTSDKGYADPGISLEAQKLIQSGAGADWQTVAVPGVWEKFGKEWANADGEAVFQKIITVPPSLSGRDLILSLGTVDDTDDTFVNGIRVGGLGDKDPASWSVPRRYTLPASLLKPGKNVIAVRIWDKYGGGGFTGRPEQLAIRPVTIAEAAKVGFYHPDYRADFDLGDEPARFYNW